MYQSIPLLELRLGAESGLSLVISRLEEHGLQAQRSFDLRTVRSTGQQDACPRHTSEPCDCQMVVLLVYRQGGILATLVIESSGGQTEVSLVSSAQQPADQQLENMIRKALR